MLADYLPSWMVKKDATTTPYSATTTTPYSTDNPFGVRQESAQYGPFTNAPDAGEFGDIGTFTEPITRAVKNAARMLSTDSLSAGAQTNSRSWWDFSGKVADSASSIGAGIQSTLTKVIILVVVVAVVALFGMSYVQAKGNQLANK